MTESATVLSFSQACQAVDEHVRSLPGRVQDFEDVPLLEALGRVLADVVVADRPQPPFNRATRDGYAGRAAEFVAGEVKLAGMLRAGEHCSEPLVPGTCIEIMTGAPVPDGADCVLMVEHGTRSGERITMQATRSISAGDNIVPKGAEAAQHAALLGPGMRIRPSGIAVAAACGYAQLKVARRPRVAILATGDELVDVGLQPDMYQIRNSNSYALAAQVAAAGGAPEMYAPVPDEADALERAIENAAGSCDLVLLSGGVSMGKYDLVEPALLQCGARFVFTGVRMQPGKPLVFGTLREGRVPFFGLPGNPVSTRVCFSVFVTPLLAALGGEATPSLRIVQASLTSAVAAKPGLTRLLPAAIHYAQGNTTVQAVPWQGSGDIAGTVRADCFLLLPEDGEALQSGDRVSVLLAE